MKKEKILNIPNALCFFRIALVPVFIYLYIHANSSKDLIICALLLAVSGISDCLDGYIARKYNMITDFGKFIDPVADKLTQFSIVVCLVWKYPIGVMFLLLGIIILKDGMIAVVSAYLLNYGLRIKGSSWWGKIATVFFYFSIIALMLFNLKGSIVHIIIFINCLFMALAWLLYGKELYYMYIHREELKVFEK